MSTETKTQKFKRVFCNTLQQDEDGNNYLKIPILDYEDLSYFRNNIVDAIELIADLHIIDQNSTDVSVVGFTLKTLSHILKSTSMIEECNGIEQLFKN